MSSRSQLCSSAPPARAARAARLPLLGLAVAACSGRAVPPAASPPPSERASLSESTSPVVAEAPPAELSRRGWPALGDGAPLLEGISYGPYREGQRPGGPDPSEAELREDLAILDARWQMIRVYSSRGPTEDILRLIAEEELELKVMLGAWIAPLSEEGAAEANAEEVAEAVRLANAFPEEVVAVSVGNETQVSWSAHRSDPGALVAHIRAVRAGVSQPVSTADDYNFWNKPESHAVAREVDFLLLHAYAMWNQQQLEDAVPWTAATVAAVQAEHPELTVVLGETGWATELDPEGDEVQWIKAPAGEAEQARFHGELTAWAREEALPLFYFEAFDEPWKGSADPREVEKHWGLYDVNRQPKQALQHAQGTEEVP